MINYRPTGQLMTVPSKDVEEGVEKEMKAGDIVSFSYEASSRRDVPSGIKVFRIRLDLSWEDVIINHSRDSGTFISFLFILLLIVI